MTTLFFCGWWLLVNGFIGWSALDFLQNVLGHTQRPRRLLWLFVHASITLLVLRYQIPGAFFLALGTALLFARRVLRCPWRVLAAPMTVLFTLLTLLEGSSALVMAWAAGTLPSPFWGLVFQCLLSLLTAAVLFLALRAIRRRYAVLGQALPALYLLLLPCLCLNLGMRAGLRLDSRDFAPFLSALDVGTGPLLLLVLLCGGVLLFLPLQALCGLIVPGRQERAMLLETLQGQGRCLEEERRSSARTAAFRHDLHNHLLVLSGLLRDRAYPDAQNYAEALHRRSTALSAPPATGCPALDALLAEKLAQARAAGIVSVCTVAIPPGLGLDALDLCALFGNLLDNALQACRALDGDQRRFTLRTSVRGKLLVVESANPTPPGHTVTPGTGLGNIQRIARRAQGSVQITQGADGFRIRVLLCAR